jgi:arylsulfatase A-like enzyme
MYQDRAAGVRARAEAALADHESGRPLFLFVHLYDPHAPYDAPEPWKMAFVDPEYRGLFAGKRFQRSVLDQALKNGTAEPADLDYVASRYLGEVAYVDEQIGLLLDSLRAQGLLEHALVAVVADHGETLGERSFFAYSHGSEVTDEVMRVPLILRGYGVPLATHAVVQRQAEMAGLAPTLEVALGLRPTLGTARPFYDLVRPGPVADEDGWPERPTRTVLMEAARPRDLEDAARWNNLTFARGVRAGGWVLRLSPAYDQPPRLWDGPGDQVHITDDAIRPVLAGLLGRWDLDSPPHRTEVVTADTHEALRALGYLDDGRPTGSPVDNLGDEGEVPPDP